MLPSNTIDDGTKAVKPKNQIFEDEEKSKLLQKLLQSKNPDDLHAANKLIKTMVKEVCDNLNKLEFVNSILISIQFMFIVG